jgi:chromosome segregation ATPase
VRMLAEGLAEPERRTKAAAAGEAPKVASSPSNLSKNQRQQLERRISEIEKTLPELESRATRLAEQISSSEVAADFERLSGLSAEHSELERQIREMYDEWESAAESLQ